NKAQMQVISRIKGCAEKIDLSLNRTPSQPADNTAASTTPQEKLAAEYESLTAKRSHIRERELRANPDIIEDVMSEIVAAENAATAVCGAPAGPDLALILIARIHGMATP
ncbi:MAG TPA: hypothetical protein VFM10_09555, partial [Terriglobales bacterium]|nr:hypothetical protein [Terriglobales bacterium]